MLNAFVLAPLIFRCGKTTVCQLLSSIESKALYSVNCHMHTESSDFLGGLRPVRHRSYEVGSCDDYLGSLVCSLVKNIAKGGLTLKAFLHDLFVFSKDEILTF